MVKTTAHKDDVAQGLHKLSVLASDAGAAVELALCHGAVMTVAYAYTVSQIAPARLEEPAGRADPVIARVTAEQRLPTDWLQEDVKYCLALFAAQRRTDYDRFGPNPILSMSEPAHVLAMKLHASARSCHVHPFGLMRAPLPTIRRASAGVQPRAK